MDRKLDDIRRELNALADLHPDVVQVIAIAKATGVTDPELIFRAAVAVVYGRVIQN